MIDARTLQGKESWETTCWSEEKLPRRYLSDGMHVLCVIIARGHMTRRCADGVLNPIVRRHYLGFAPLVPAFTARLLQVTLYIPPMATLIHY
jgi:hypothetical protein